MKKENRVYLAAIRRDMQARFQFENRNDAFATLWYGWIKRCLRKKGGYMNVFLLKWKRGYIHVDEANDFWKYICE